MSFTDEEIKCILDLFVAYAGEDDEKAQNLIKKMQLFIDYKDKEIEFFNIRNEFMKNIAELEKSVDNK